MCVCPKGVCISIVCVTLYGTQTYLLHCKAHSTTRRSVYMCVCPKRCVHVYHLCYSYKVQHTAMHTTQLFARCFRVGNMFRMSWTPATVDM